MKPTEEKAGPTGSTLALADDLNPWPTPRISQQRQIEQPIHGSEEPTAAEVTDLASAEVALSERRPQMVIEDPSSLDDHLVEQVFQEETDLQSQDNGFGGNL